MRRARLRLIELTSRSRPISFLLGKKASELFVQLQVQTISRVVHDGRMIVQLAKRDRIVEVELDWLVRVEEGIGKAHLVVNLTKHLL